ncbi:type IV pilus modification protein PilV [Oceanicoccus sagamiensis]|uniref:Type IV pilus modification protein PilV n=1 Tax=Oceanicoccus sagamiensis TaxID=716816 RepID=A0A1X9NGF3_9GAMM|nr:type IV pilus modification protein PilV [Oceanicoccus sagamiensis]ARN75472.1 type IV pilus modification protein PilV [Oceanicoccus sagamiensis]
MMHRQYVIGFALLEVVITMFVMAVGLLGMAALQSASVKNSLDTGARSQITWMTSEIVERIRSNPGASGNSYSTNMVPANCAVPAKACADNYTGNAIGNPLTGDDTCSADEVASYDIWDTFCGVDVGEGVLSGSSDLLELQNLTISCDTCGTTVIDSDYTVSISWISQSIADEQSMDSGEINTRKVRTISMKVYP